MKTSTRFIIGTAIGTWALSAHGQTAIRFDQLRYDIAPGQTFGVQVLMDPAPATGLFSYGVRFAWPSTNAQVGSISSISVPGPLDFNGVSGSGAVKALNSGSAAVKGTVDFSFSPIQSYSHSLLASFSVTDSRQGSFTLRLAPFNTLGPTEEIFVDGTGFVLDPELTFGAALVNYRPLVCILTPTNGATFLAQQSISLTADAQDLDGTVTNVIYFDGTNRVGAALATPYLVTWTGAAVGVHVLNAVASDNLGVTGTSSNVVITIRSNSPPALAPIADKTVVAGTLLSFTATATDPDSPPQTLTFSLDPGAPLGATMTPAGSFTWNPTVSQGPSTNQVTVHVTDNGLPPLSDSRTFLIYVTQPAPPSEAYAIFAGASGFPNKSRVVDLSGSKSNVKGKIHSNSDINVSGNKHVFTDAPVEHVTGIDPAPDFKGKVTLIDSPITPSLVKPYPADYALATFAPGGPAASAAQAAGKYFHLTTDSDLHTFQTNGVLREGLYFVEGKVHLSGNSERGKVTVVATDEIQVSGSRSLYEPYTQCLLFFSARSGRDFKDNSLSLSGSSHKLQGVLFAPNGGLQVSGSGNVFLGSLIGLGVDLSGSELQINGSDPASCPPLVTSLVPVFQGKGKGKGLALRFPTVQGLTYIVEYSDSVASQSWQPLVSIAGDGKTITLPVPTGSPQGYYRLRIP